MNKVPNIPKMSVWMYLILIFMFGGASFWAWSTFNSVSSIWNRVLFFVMSLLFSCFFLLILLTPVEKFIISKAIINIIGWVLGGIMLIFAGYLIIFIPLIVFIVLMMTQILLYKAVCYAFNINFAINSALMYVTYLVSTTIFAYKGSSLVKFLNRYYLNKKGDISEAIRTLTQRFLQAFFFRRRAYELMIIMYILSNIEKFIKKPLFNFELWTSLSSVSLEVLLTFIAIDSYIQAFMPRMLADKDTHNENIAADI